MNHIDFDDFGKKFINDIIENDDFGLNVLESTGTFEDWARLAKDDLAYRFKCEALCGCTKGVFVFDNYDWVIKVGFTDSGIDYCAVEADNFLEAKAEGVDEWFAQTEFFAEISSMRFYIQARYDNCEDDILDSIHSVCESDSRSGNSGDVEEWLYSLMDYEDFMRVHDFMRKHHINDVHSGNVSLRDNGMPIIFDFSGFGLHF